MGWGGWSLGKLPRLRAVCTRVLLYQQMRNLLLMTALPPESSWLLHMPTKKRIQQGSLPSGQRVLPNTKIGREDSRLPSFLMILLQDEKNILQSHEKDQVLADLKIRLIYLLLSEKKKLSERIKPVVLALPMTLPIFTSFLLLMFSLTMIGNNSLSCFHFAQPQKTVFQAKLE